MCVAQILECTDDHFVYMKGSSVLLLLEHKRTTCSHNMACVPWSDALFCRIVNNYTESLFVDIVSHCHFTHFHRHMLFLVSACVHVRTESETLKLCCE